MILLNLNIILILTDFKKILNVVIKTNIKLILSIKDNNLINKYKIY